MSVRFRCQRSPVRESIDLLRLSTSSPARLYAGFHGETSRELEASASGIQDSARFTLRHLHRDLFVRDGRDDRTYSLRPPLIVVAIPSMPTLSADMH